MRHVLSTQARWVVKTFPTVPVLSVAYESRVFRRLVCYCIVHPLWVLGAGFAALIGLAYFPAFAIVILAITLFGAAIALKDYAVAVGTVVLAFVLPMLFALLEALLVLLWIAVPIALIIWVHHFLTNPPIEVNLSAKTTRQIGDLRRRG